MSSRGRSFLAEGSRLFVIPSEREGSRSNFVIPNGGAGGISVLRAFRIKSRSLVASLARDDKLVSSRRPGLWPRDLAFHQPKIKSGSLLAALVRDDRQRQPQGRFHRQVVFLLMFHLPGVIVSCNGFMEKENGDGNSNQGPRP